MVLSPSFDDCGRLRADYRGVIERDIGYGVTVRKGRQANLLYQFANMCSSRNGWEGDEIFRVYWRM